MNVLSARFTQNLHAKGYLVREIPVWNETSNRLV